MDHLLFISEQHDKKLIEDISTYLQSVLVESSYQKSYYHNTDIKCFHLYRNEKNFTVDTNYFVGVDWLVSGKAAIYVEPKLNDKEQVDFLGMLINSLATIENLEHLDGLYHVNYGDAWINIPEQKDRLSPMLIIQFLMLVQRIVQKGLKKSYYRVTKNLQSKVKGKILVGHQIKQNIVKNNFAKTICNFQEYGINTPENQYLKLVLEFVAYYLDQKNLLFGYTQVQHLRHILGHCLPYFEHVDTLSQKHEKIQVRRNSFYKEYEEAIIIGSYILKRFSFNINKISQSHASTPPFWVDMSKLFELYVFDKLKKYFPKPGALTYHDNFKGGKQTDILIRSDNVKCVIDCKYKPLYQYQDPSLADKRQLAGYTRLKSVYERLGVSYEELIKGVIIYSHQDCGEEIQIKDLFMEKIAEYVEFYKLGIRLPIIELPNP